MPMQFEAEAPIMPIMHQPRALLHYHEDRVPAINRQLRQANDWPALALLLPPPPQRAFLAAQFPLLNAGMPPPGYIEHHKSRMRGKTSKSQLSSSFRVILFCKSCSYFTEKLRSHRRSELLPTPLSRQSLRKGRRFRHGFKGRRRPLIITAMPFLNYIKMFLTTGNTGGNNEAKITRWKTHVQCQFVPCDNKFGLQSPNPGSKRIASDSLCAPKDNKPRRRDPVIRKTYQPKGESGKGKRS
jgi:hypothetical protein